MQGGMVECVPGAGYHNPVPGQVRIDVVDRDTHAELPDGEPGLVVLTHLKRRGTVLLRYSLGDISARSRERCPHCGSSTERLVMLPRRADALVKIKGMLVNPDVMMEALERALAGRAFQVAISSAEPGAALSGDVLTVRIAGPREDALAGRVALEVKDAVGVTPRVEFVDAEAIVDQSVSWKSKKLLDLRA
jgi:phenylacetate-coenzyme A ligase PaaK-like adenylate-forming protein